MYADLKEAAAKGARKCDEMLPGWYRKIDVPRLDISLPNRCVCGQLGGTYSRGLELVGLSYAGGASYGFSSCGIGAMGFLTEAWKEEIEARLLADEFAMSELVAV